MAAVAKSYYAECGDNVLAYCAAHTYLQDPLQVELQDATLKGDSMFRMLGAPEVLELGKNFLHLIGAKKALDIGTFTGASALAWALALPEDGKVLSMDVCHESLNKVGLNIIMKRPDIYNKIEFKLGSAVETLDALIEAGESGTWDFAFIDADKTNYPNYYDKVVQLLRPGGVILLDNALWSGRVLHPEDAETKSIAKVNDIIYKDERTRSALLNVGDGLHIAFKK